MLKLMYLWQKLLEAIETSMCSFWAAPSGGCFCLVWLPVLSTCPLVRQTVITSDIHLGKRGTTCPVKRKLLSSEDKSQQTVNLNQHFSRYYLFKQFPWCYIFKMCHTLHYEQMLWVPAGCMIEKYRSTKVVFWFWLGLLNWFRRCQWRYCHWSHTGRSLIKAFVTAYSNTLSINR